MLYLNGFQFWHHFHWDTVWVLWSWRTVYYDCSVQWLFHFADVLYISVTFILRTVANVYFTMRFGRASFGYTSDLYSALSWLSWGIACVNEGWHSFTCHPHVYPQVEWTIPAFTPQPQSITALWLVIISRPTEGRRLNWPGWLGELLRWFACRRWSPIPVLTGPIVE